jgi:hypothetical protein
MYNYNTVSGEASQSRQVVLCEFLMICIILIDAGISMVYWCGMTSCHGNW